MIIRPALLSLLAVIAFFLVSACTKTEEEVRQSSPISLPTQTVGATVKPSPPVAPTRTPTPTPTPPTPQQQQIPAPQPTQAAPPRSNCSPSYPTVCIPPAPPDLDCGDIPYKRFQVLPPDPHKFDADKDGIGCES